MSIYSGRADLCDLIMMQKHRTESGSDKKEDLEQARILYSDELECFEIFKKKTGGVIHQMLKVEVTENNQELLAQKCPAFKVYTFETEKEDKRFKSGKRKEVFYNYEYNGEKYPNLKELNKKFGGIYIPIDIHFNTLLDIIPYYPYVVAMANMAPDHSEVYISSVSEVIEQRNAGIKCGVDPTFWEYYAKRLQDHYKTVVLRYFMPEGEQIEEIEFDDEGNGKTKYPINYNLDIDFVDDDSIKIHYSDVKVIDYDQGLIKVHKFDLPKRSNKLKIKYYKKPEFKLYLN